MTLLDSRLLSEYAFQRMAGAVTGLASRDFEHKDASRIDKISTGQEGNSVGKTAGTTAFSRKIGACGAK